MNRAQPSGVPPALKMSDVTVGMRLRDPDDYRFRQEGILTVTAITPLGFTYDAERNVSLGARHGVMLAKGRQHFGLDGLCRFIPIGPLAAAEAREAAPQAVDDDRCGSCGCRRWEHAPAAIHQTGGTDYKCVCGSCGGWKLAARSASSCREALVTLRDEFKHSALVAGQHSVEAMPNEGADESAGRATAYKECADAVAALLARAAEATPADCDHHWVVEVGYGPRGHGASWCSKCHAPNPAVHAEARADQQEK